MSARHPSWDTYEAPEPDPFRIVHIARDGAQHIIRLHDTGNDWDRYHVKVNGDFIAFGDDHAAMLAIFHDVVAYFGRI